MPQDTVLSCFSKIFAAQLKVFGTVVHNAIFNIFLDWSSHLKTGIFLIIEFCGLEISNSPYLVNIVIEVIFAEFVKIEVKMVKLPLDAL